MHRRPFFNLFGRGEAAEVEFRWLSENVAQNGYVREHETTCHDADGHAVIVELTAIADEFGGPIPVGGFALIGGEEIGKVVVESIGSSPAVLLKNHGVFTIGKNAESAVKAAIMTEDVARTVWYALALGTPDVIPADNVAKLHARYTNVYGQR
jgi:L-ribulose-5-phosphate 4-epimerase